MLPAADGGPRTDVAVRYLPAVGTLNVCGDWYDLVELSGTRPAVAVGDVVGHGLAAAGVMGQLRSALSRRIQVVGAPRRCCRRSAATPAPSTGRWPAPPSRSSSTGRGR
ncbi:SpoIIE family protein phosphatase [Actinoallomurus sp. CA-142502]|uniref:SpoIIE family protein phosphatase n=1 Tax=Actinoallomurus sp. CA-142502 TaxID=3239885 RepID=UPI003D900815